MPIDIPAVDHDAVIKSNLIPVATCHVDIPDNCNLGSFSNGDTRVGVKDSAIRPNSAVRQVMEIGTFFNEKIDWVLCAFANTDGVAIETIGLIGHRHNYCG